MLAEARGLAEDLDLKGILRRVAAEKPVPGGTETRFGREGEFWTIVYAGTTFRLRDVKGLRHIAYLLASPGMRCTCSSSCRAGRPPAAGCATRTRRRGALQGFTSGGRRPVARRTPRSRSFGGDSRSSDAELEEATRFSDDERAARIDEERDALIGELSRAAGLGEP